MTLSNLDQISIEQHRGLVSYYRPKKSTIDRIKRMYINGRPFNFFVIDSRFNGRVTITNYEETYGEDFSLRFEFSGSVRPVQYDW